MLYTMKNCMMEWSYNSGRKYKDPFNEIELSAVITDPDGKQNEVPAFWAGDDTWRIRYASSKMGYHHFRTTCSDMSNTDLHGREGDILIAEYEGNNTLLKHGRLCVSESRKYLEHRDGIPFFWLGDTWWMGLASRLRWPEDFQLLAADRVEKGFSVIQIVAGLYPDMAPFDKRGANEAGFPWEKGYTHINPYYFDIADLKISWLVKSGLVPCIVGSWGYFINFAGKDALKKHWRYLIARYGAYPVVWCLAGEALMPFYGSVEREDYEAWARAEWTEITEYVRSIDPFRNPVTIHPTDFGHKMVDDPLLLDIDMLQTGHNGWESLAQTADMMEATFASAPHMPVIDSEVCYEGIGGGCGPDIQRFLFWENVLSGAAGHTYGANGIWQVNTMEKPYGISPHGMTWGNTPWEEAYRLPGSKQIGFGKRLLERYQWWRFEPHPEWSEPHAGRNMRIAPYAAGIPGEVRMIYIPVIGFHGQRPIIRELEKGIIYRAFFFDPVTGDEYGIGEVTADENGNWQSPSMSKLMPGVVLVYQDLLLVLENKSVS
ncbi:MAG: DUF4038 domain-containing protein [Clostridiales bacterium]|nr:DUF4038 domain-containing protein [Clostridiales bacterium]